MLGSSMGDEVSEASIKSIQMDVQGIQGDQKGPRSGTLSWVPLSPKLKLYVIWTKDHTLLRMWLLQWIHKPKHSSKKPKHQTIHMSKWQTGIHHPKEQMRHWYWWFIVASFFVNHPLEVLVAVHKMAPNLLFTTGKTTKRVLQSLKLLVFTPAPSYAHPFSCMDDWERMLWPSPPTTSAIDGKNLGLRWSSLLI